jgi:hypothetical protein
VVINVEWILILFFGTGFTGFAGYFIRHFPDESDEI